MTSCCVVVVVAVDDVDDVVLCCVCSNFVPSPTQPVEFYRSRLIG